jgi:hypothetical protein
MNEQDILRRLAATAGPHAPPMVDVTDWVLADLALARRRRVDPALTWFAAVAAVAAAIVVGATLGTWVDWQDPLAEMLQLTAVIL